MGIAANILMTVMYAARFGRFDLLRAVSGLATFLQILYSPNKGGTTGVGFLLTLYRITFARQDLPLPPTCLDLPRLA